MDKKVTSLSSNNDAVNSMSTMYFDSESHDMFDLTQSPTNSSESDNVTSNSTTSSTNLVNVDVKKDEKKKRNVLERGRK